MAESDDDVAVYGQRHYSGHHRRRHRDSDLSDYSSDKPRPRSRRRKSTVDRIGALPDSLLVHILSFLPIEDAIKTETLSKRWQFLWTYLPSLLFRFHRCPYDGDYSYRDADTADFVIFVDKTLLLCNCSKIKKFAVDFDYEPGFASNVNSWTRYAARNRTEEFRLGFLADKLDEDEFYVLPQLLYTNSSFKELHFSCCSVMPSGVVGWKSLKKLSIGYVKLSDDLINNILAGSPVLEILELYYFYGINRLHISNASMKKLILREFWDHAGVEFIDGSELEISIPNLHSLEILGGFERKNCRLVDVNSLVEATLNFDLVEDDTGDNEFDDFSEHRNILRGLLQSLVNVKNITLGNWALQVLSIMQVKGLRSPVLKCESLTFNTCFSEFDLPGIVNLLACSPSLETLVITMSSFRSYEYYNDMLGELCNFDEKHYWTSQKRTFKCLMLHLKRVEFSGVIWYQLDSFFPFAQFLLKNARVLQKMVISVLRVASEKPKEVFQGAQKLLSFPRSSSDAVVLFYA